MVSTGGPREGLIQKVIAASTRNPGLTIFAMEVFALWGYYALRNVPLDAIPDLSDTQVIILTDLAVTLMPALAVLFIRGRVRSEDEDPLNR